MLYIYACICVHICVCLCVCIYTCIYIYIYIYIYICIRNCKYRTMFLLVFILGKFFLFFRKNFLFVKFLFSWHRFSLSFSVLHAGWKLLMFSLEVMFHFAEKFVHSCKSKTNKQKSIVYIFLFLVLISQKLYKSSVSNIVNNICYKTAISGCYVALGSFYFVFQLTLL